MAMTDQLISRNAEIQIPIFPDLQWERIWPEGAGFDVTRLADAKQWLDKQVGNGHYRVVIVRSGRVVTEWNYGFNSRKRFPAMAFVKSVFLRYLPSAAQPFRSNRNNTFVRKIQIPLASAAKSIFSCILGIAIHEGKIPSADAKIVDFYPEAMNISRR